MGKRMLCQTLGQRGTDAVELEEHMGVIAMFSSRIVRLALGGELGAQLGIDDVLKSKLGIDENLRHDCSREVFSSRFLQHFAPHDLRI